jgi:glycosyltransferase involved in cell wall biosynthesis
VTVVRNTFPTAGAPTPPTHRPRALLYAGRIDEDRDLATARVAVPDLPVPLDVLGGGDARSIASLRSAGASVRDAVPITRMADELADAGLSLVSLSGNQLNHRVALPNKLFQAVQAGVPVVAADLPAIREVVDGHGIGTLYRPGDPASLVDATADAVTRHGELVRNVVSARSELSWERDEERLMEVYERIELRRAP